MSLQAPGDLREAARRVTYPLLTMLHSLALTTTTSTTALGGPVVVRAL